MTLDTLYRRNWIMGISSQSIISQQRTKLHILHLLYGGWMNNKEILITGGTGSLGKTLVKHIKNTYSPRGIRIYSRDELKQWEFRKELSELGLDKNVAFLIGDVCNYERLHRSLDGVHNVINCAAMKQVPACEENPSEASKTNIQGAHNLIQACINQGVEKLMHISTDKAVYPVNFYGVTKSVAEKLFIHSNIYNRTRFNVCRYGNVLGSRGSIIPLFHRQLQSGKITITDIEMTRFWIELDNVVEFICKCMVYDTAQGLIFVPRMPSMKIINIAEYMIDYFKFKGITIEEIGIRPGEKLHECLITFEESRHMIQEENKFVIHPPSQYTSDSKNRWAYYSDTNDIHLTKQDFFKMIEKYMQSKKGEI